MAKTKETITPSQPESNPDGTLISYGNSVRMERNPNMQPNGEFLWTVYALQPVTDGTHPTDGIEHTTEAAVWVPKLTSSEDAARKMCVQLSGATG